MNSKDFSKKYTCVKIVSIWNASNRFCGTSDNRDKKTSNDFPIDLIP